MYYADNYLEINRYFLVVSAAGNVLLTAESALMKTACEHDVNHYKT